MTILWNNSYYKSKSSPIRATPKVSRLLRKWVPTTSSYLMMTAPVKVTSNQELKRLPQTFASTTPWSTNLLSCNRCLWIITTMRRVICSSMIAKTIVVTTTIQATTNLSGLSRCFFSISNSIFNNNNSHSRLRKIMKEEGMAVGTTLWICLQCNTPTILLKLQYNSFSLNSSSIAKVETVGTGTFP